MDRDEQEAFVAKALTGLIVFAAVCTGALVAHLCSAKQWGLAALALPPLGTLILGAFSAVAALKECGHL